jgi:antitoxin ParD1/3/4
MTTMNISLPAAMRKFVEKQVSEEGYSTASEYIRTLVREEQKRKAKEKLESLILEGLNSGESIEVTPEYWEEIRRRLQERGAKRKKRA